MPRRNRRELNPEPQVEAVAERILGPESVRREGFEVSFASNKAKRYRCPYCEGWIAPGSRHVVAVPVGDADARRHYHSGCWSKHLKAPAARPVRW
jgi:hypothetical protein